MKHVWDPSGFPFVATQASPALENLTNYHRRVLDLNSCILSSPDTQIIFLRRRNQFERILSDLLGQQTDLWGPASSDGRISPVDETAIYRASINRKNIEAVDMEVIDWYLRHIPSLEHELRTSIPDRNECLDVYFEDVFGADVSSDARIRKFRQILDFLGCSADPASWPGSTVERLFQPQAKLNNPDTFGLIPNLAEVQMRFSKMQES